jgi:hypothetical protein
VNEELYGEALGDPLDLVTYFEVLRARSFASPGTGYDPIWPCYYSFTEFWCDLVAMNSLDVSDYLLSVDKAVPAVLNRGRCFLDAEFVEPLCEPHVG